MSSTWAGRCPNCGEWNTLEIKYDGQKNKLLPLVSQLLNDGAELKEPRMLTHIEGIDLVFGGGIVQGSVNLISGEPGMGKSTLLLQIAAAISKDSQVLYVSGEESLHQIWMRAERLGLLKSDNLQVATTNSTDEIVNAINSGQSKLVIIDSIQTISCQDVGSSAGSISQVTNSSAMLASSAKQSNTAIIIVGHVTKEGNIAGPKLLEHIVDVVLSLEGDQSGGLKLMRVSKNRFGSTNETAIFEMKQTGLMPVLNPSAVLLAERKVTDGSIVLATIEGSRPILVEVQALVNQTSYGYPKRAVSGLDLSRLNLLIAMIEKRTSLKLGDKDIYVNIVGGLKVNEPAADLAVAMAICSAARGKKLKDNSVVFGEVGLSGEIRHVPYIERRIAEAQALGFDYAIGPKIPNIKNPTFLKPISEIKSALNLYLS
jgi:DNA repair protein RadA/Sms